MIHKKRVPEIDGMRIDEAHKGGFVGSLLSGGGGIGGLIGKAVGLVTGKNDTGPSGAEQKGITAQDKELADLKKKEDARKAAMGRKRQGRGSLLSGSETGVVGQQLKNLLG